MPSSTPSTARPRCRAVIVLAVAAGAAGLFASPAGAAQQRYDLPVPSVGLPAIALPEVPLPSGVPQPKISAPFHPKSLLAHTRSGQRPNGPTTDPVISGDGRIARWAAYTSTATDIVAGSGAVANVYLVERLGPPRLNGTPWQERRTILASEGRGGPADGPSWGASLDGREISVRGEEVPVAPSCVAFVSAASNLVAGDTDGAANVFVRRLASGRLTRIPSSAGATEVDLDGTCDRVAFVSRGVARVADTDGRGRAMAISEGAASDLELSSSGRIATYERSGSAWLWTERIGADTRRRLASASNPTANSYGSDIAYQRGQDLFLGRLKGGLSEERMASPLTDERVYATTAPSMTAGGHFVFFGIGPYVDSNVFRNFALCPYQGASVGQVMASGHGNYAVFSCSTGESWLSYVGPK